ncbi:MAG: hypothetical protein K6G73_05685 [Marinilabiliaceae bacterium]|nr:hypothetical protein [Marinilabiliaceae bacterium]
MTQIDNAVLETRDKCNVYYDAWQIQCCGEPFAVGDYVKWTGNIATKENILNGMVMDFYEEHHSGATHTIAGTVSKIFAEQSETPHYKDKIIHRDSGQLTYKKLYKADGWESELESDNTTDRTFGGYIVELENAVIEQLEPQYDDDDE